jgi:hypothetical protein
VLFKTCRPKHRNISHLVTVCDTLLKFCIWQQIFLRL